MKQSIPSASEVTLLNKPIRTKLQRVYIFKSFPVLKTICIVFSRLRGLQLLQCVLVMSAILPTVINIYHQEPKNV